jgi:hypothetical protein
MGELILIALDKLGNALGFSKRKIFKRSFYLCMRCDSLYRSNDHTDCFGCNGRTDCLSQLASANIIREGICYKCESKKSREQIYDLAA